jgi:hypothetical protein
MINDTMKQIEVKRLELARLENQYNDQIEAERTAILKGKSDGISKSLYLLGFEFESSCSRTEQYLEFHRTFKRELTNVLKPLCSKIEIGSPNHFDVSGFFQLLDGRIFYFRLEDLRWSKDNILVRTAKHFKDYSGGSNGFIKLDADFVENLKRFLA